jgi:hypothetical protein
MEVSTEVCPGSLCGLDEVGVAVDPSSIVSGTGTSSHSRPLTYIVGFYVRVGRRE